MGLFLQCQGQFGTFLYTDPTDNAVTAQAIATGDGSTTTFTFDRSLGGFAEPVGWVTSRLECLSQRRQPGLGLVADDAEQPCLRPRAGSGVAIAASFAYAFHAGSTTTTSISRSSCENLWKREEPSIPLGALRQMKSDHDRRHQPASTRRAPRPTRRSRSPIASPSRCRRERSHLDQRRSSGRLTTARPSRRPARWSRASNTRRASASRSTSSRSRSPRGRPISSTARRSSFALRDGAFDGATVHRDRVFLTALGGTVVGGVTLFQGRVSTVDMVGRTQATVTVASDLVDPRL